MKTHSLTQYALMLIVLGASWSTGNAQASVLEQTAIEEQIDAFFTSWNKHDFSDMKKYMSKDCDFVNIVGMHWKGREDVQYAHQAIHERIFKDIPIEKRAMSIRVIGSNVAVAHVVMHPMKTFTTPDGTTLGDNDSLATFVLVKRNSVWLVEAVENVVVDEKAKKFDPVTIRNNR